MARPSTRGGLPTVIATLALALTGFLLAIGAAAAWAAGELLDDAGRLGTAAREAIDSPDGSEAAAELLVEGALDAGVASVPERFQGVAGSEAVRGAVRERAIPQVAEGLRRDAALDSIERATRATHDETVAAVRDGTADQIAVGAIELAAGWRTLRDVLDATDVLQVDEDDLDVRVAVTVEAAPGWVRALRTLDEQAAAAPVAALLAALAALSGTGLAMWRGRALLAAAPALAPMAGAAAALVAIRQATVLAGSPGEDGAAAGRLEATLLRELARGFEQDAVTLVAATALAGVAAWVVLAVASARRAAG